MFADSNKVLFRARRLIACLMKTTSQLNFRVAVSKHRWPGAVRYITRTQEKTHGESRRNVLCSTKVNLSSCENRECKKKLQVENGSRYALMCL